MYFVIDAPVTGAEAAQQGAVGRIDNGIGIEPGDISLPENQLTGMLSCIESTFLQCWQGRDINNAFFPYFPLQQPVLYCDKIRAELFGRPHIHESPQQSAL